MLPDAPLSIPSAMDQGAKTPITTKPDHQWRPQSWKRTHPESHPPDTTSKLEPSEHGGTVCLAPTPFILVSVSQCSQTSSTQSPPGMRTKFKNLFRPKSTSRIPSPVPLAENMMEESARSETVDMVRVSQDEVNYSHRSMPSQKLRLPRLQTRSRPSWWILLHMERRRLPAS